MESKDMARQSRRLLQLGSVLFLGALALGLAIPALAVPRLGLSAHLNGVVGSLFLWMLGLLWPRLRLGPRARTAAFWLAVYGFFAVTVTPLLGGIWGAGGSVLPMAAGAARGSALQEGVLGAGLATVVLATLALAVLLVFGLRGRREDA